MMIRKGRLRRDLARDWQKYLMLLIPLTLVIVFSYIPMYGVQIAFKDFNLRKGIWGSRWVGFDNFVYAFSLPKFGRVVRNTLMLNMMGLLIGFPAPIILALILNEMRRSKIKRVVQTISYIPHFLSTVIIYGITLQLCTPYSGTLNQIYLNMSNTLNIVNRYTQSGGLPFLTNESWWMWTYTLTGVWSGIGWGSIIYIAAITSINPELYEAAEVDGAGRLKRIWHITLPGIRPTIVLKLILDIGGIAAISFDKPFLFGNAIVNNVSEVISVYVYNVGIGQAEFDLGTVVGLAQSAVSVTLILIANKIAHLLGEAGLWEGGKSEKAKLSRKAKKGVLR